MIVSKDNINGIFAAVGNTKLLRLDRIFPESGLEIYAKLENLNPGGSFKDRSSINIIQKAINLGKITKNTVIIESTSGNMGVGLAQACLYFGLKLILVIDPLINPHTEKLLVTFGARLIRVKQKDDSGSYLMSRLDKVKSLVKQEPNSFWTNQYENNSNPEAQRLIARELLDQMDNKLDYLFVGTGTGGTIMGCLREIQYRGLETIVVPVDVMGSKIFDAPKGNKKIPGIGAGQKSNFILPEYLHLPVYVDDRESVMGCRKLLQREAILAGGSTGAVVAAISKMRCHLRKNSKIAFLISDSGERYLTTIYDNDWVYKNLKLAL
ncbi:MAG: 2,3-diaminopropionate biosynthesis protein SbnA [Cyclobacteriaceae bacterium]